MCSFIKEELLNPRMVDKDDDFFYHLNIGKNSPQLKETFGDTKFVCMGGSQERAKFFAQAFARQTGLADPGSIMPVIEKTDRYTVYKVGQVIFMSHGIGMPSMGIILQEITKVLHYAECESVQYMRVGTSGGVGVEPGTVVISTGTLNDELQADTHAQNILGKRREEVASLPKEIAEAIEACRGDINAVFGRTLGTQDFYLGQGRLDMLENPPYTEEEVREFIAELKRRGVKNIEMESTLFAAFCHRLGIPGAILCSAIVNRDETDQVTAGPDKLRKYSADAEQVAINYMAKELKLNLVPREAETE